MRRRPRPLEGHGLRLRAAESGSRIYSNPGHVYLEVAGIRFDTSGQRATGSRWQNALRDHKGYVARHPAGL